MKKNSIISLCVGAILAAAAAPFVFAYTHTEIFTVQGIDYMSTIPADAPMKAARKSVAATKVKLSSENSDFTFDKIESWTGEGENRAAMVIQWNDGRETSALVFGYRWDGVATGSDMFRAVVANNPRLYGLIQYTNVSSPTDSNGGYTANGIGWDFDNDGEISLFDSENEEYYSADLNNGLFIHPRGYNPGNPDSRPDYDYDNWQSTDKDDLWQAGWYQGYWSYWTRGEEDTTMSYSGLGMSGRVLTDGSWDGWSYSTEIDLNDPVVEWKTFKAAPAPTPADAKTEFANGDLFYRLTSYAQNLVAVVNPNTLSEIPNASYRAFSGETLHIPATFTDDETGKTYTVATVAEGAFTGLVGVKAVELPETVHRINEYAFSGMSDLQTVSATDGVNLDENLLHLGAGVFSGCTNLTTFVLPTAMTIIPVDSYNGCKLTEDIEINERITDIGDRAFANSGIKNLVIPASVRRIGENAFNSENILSVTTDATVPAEISGKAFSQSTYANAVLTVPTGFKEVYNSVQGWSAFEKVYDQSIEVNVGDRFISNGINYVVTDNGNESPQVKVSYCNVEGNPNATLIRNANGAGYVGDLTVPAKVAYMGRDFNVTAIADSAFYFASELTSLTVDADIKTVGKVAFYFDKKLDEVKFNSGVEEIGTQCFYSSGISKMVFPEGIKKLAYQAFYGCSNLKEIYLPSSLELVSGSCFARCGLESVELTANIPSWGASIFWENKNLKSVKLAEGLTEIYGQMFRGCSALEHIDIPSSVTKIGSYAFAECTSLTIDLPETVKEIEAGAFGGTLNELFVLPQEITEIGMETFKNCKNLKEIVVSDELESIGEKAFSGCSSLERFLTWTYHELEVELEEMLMEPGEFYFPEYLSVVGTEAFNGCDLIKEIYFEDGLQSIAKKAFINCSGLEDVFLPNSLTVVQDEAFRYCTSLKSVRFGNKLTETGDYSFGGCTSLEKLNTYGYYKGDNKLPSTMEIIGEYCFDGCTSLKEVIIPKSVKYCSGSFRNCEGLEKVTFESGSKMESIYSSTFENTGLTSITLPSTVTSLGAWTFRNSKNLKSIELPNKLTSIGRESFKNTALTELVLPTGFKAKSYDVDIVQGCPEDLKIYVLNTGEPAELYATNWQISTGKYPTVYVAPGLKETYQANSNWGQFTIKEPTFDYVDNLDFEYDMYDGAYDEVWISLTLSGDFYFEETLPRKFKLVAETQLHKAEATDVHLVRRQVDDNEQPGEQPEITPEDPSEENEDENLEGNNLEVNDYVSYASDDESGLITDRISWPDYGIDIVIADRPLMTTTYATYLRYRNNGKEYRSPEQLITIEGSNINTSVGFNFDDDASSDEVLYYTIDGQQVDGRNLSSGIYIERCGGKAKKIIVK